MSGAGGSGAHPPATLSTSTKVDPKFRILFESLLSSVVTVAADDGKKITQYGTGFVLLGDRKSCIVVTSSHLMDAGRTTKFSVYMQTKHIYRAGLLAHKPPSRIIFLVLRDIAEDVVPVRISANPVKWETVFTIGLMAGTKYNSGAKQEYVLSASGPKNLLGNYIGTTIDSSLEAFDSSGETIAGGGAYFTLTCSMQDKAVKIECINDVDHDEKHTANLLLSAPVFNLEGEMVGLIFSTGNVPDVKIALHANQIQDWINILFETTTSNWKNDLTSLMLNTKVETEMPKVVKGKKKL